MTRSGLELISNPGTSLPRPVGTRSPPVAIIAVTMVTLGLGLAWYVWAKSSLEGVLDRQDEAVLVGTGRAFEALIEQRKTDLEAQARVLVDDARIRTTLATPGIDAATVEDVLRDLQAASGYALYAVIDRRGVVRAVVGDDGLRGLDLGTSALAKRVRTERSASDVWAQQSRVLVLAAAPVRLGEELSAQLLIGDTIGPTSLGAVPGVSAALVSGGSVVAGTDDVALTRVALLAPATVHRVPDGHPARVARSLALGEGSARAVAVWALERHRGRAALGGLGAPWMPLAVIAVCATGVFVLSLSSSRKGV